MASCGSLRSIAEDVKVDTGVSVTPGVIPIDSCIPADPHENQAGAGNTCGEKAVELGELADDGGLTTVVGNLRHPTDRDWFWVRAVDLGGDEARGWEDFRLDVAVTRGQGHFDIRVLRGGCENATDECDGVGYDSYSWFIEDNEPDELGDLPEEPQACGDPPLDGCDDWTGDYYIEVVRSDGLQDCVPYELTISNGVWSSR